MSVVLPSQKSYMLAAQVLSLLAILLGAEKRLRFAYVATFHG